MANILRKFKTLVKYGSAGAVGVALSHWLEPRKALNLMPNDGLFTDQIEAKCEEPMPLSPEIEAAMKRVREVMAKRAEDPDLRKDKKVVNIGVALNSSHKFFELIGEEEFLWYYKDVNNEYHCVRVTGLLAKHFFKVIEDVLILGEAFNSKTIEFESI